MGELTNLPNIGNVLAEELEASGITTYQQLADCGSVKAVLQLSGTVHVCLNKLYALEGAIRGIRWHELPKEVRQQLKEEYIGQLKT